MGICHASSRVGSDFQAIDTSSFIHHRLLLLGPHGSGKTSIIRHIQMMYNAFATRRSRLSELYNIRHSCYAIVHTMIQCMKDYDQCHRHIIDMRYVNVLAKLLDGHHYLTSEAAEYTYSLAKEGILADILIKISAPFDARDIAFVAQCAARSLKDDYVPSDADLLRIHWQTVGIHTTCVHVPSLARTFELVECGGHLSERRKWSSLYSLPNWSHVVYCVALDSWCWNMSEDANTNRMLDAISTFSQLCHDPHLQRVPKIVIFNKLDVFRSRLTDHLPAFRRLFPDYDGGTDIHRAIEYLSQKFVDASLSLSPPLPLPSPLNARTHTSESHVPLAATTTYSGAVPIVGSTTRVIIDKTDDHSDHIPTTPNPSIGINGTANLSNDHRVDHDNTHTGTGTGDDGVGSSLRLSPLQSQPLSLSLAVAVTATEPPIVSIVSPVQPDIASSLIPFPNDRSNHVPLPPLSPLSPLSPLFPPAPVSSSFIALSHMNGNGNGGRIIGHGHAHGLLPLGITHKPAINNGHGHGNGTTNGHGHGHGHVNGNDSVPMSPSTTMNGTRTPMSWSAPLSPAMTARSQMTFINPSHINDDNNTTAATSATTASSLAVPSLISSLPSSSTVVGVSSSSLQSSATPSRVMSRTVSVEHSHHGTITTNSSQTSTIHIGHVGHTHIGTLHESSHAHGHGHSHGNGNGNGNGHHMGINGNSGHQKMTLGNGMHTWTSNDSNDSNHINHTTPKVDSLTHAPSIPSPTVLPLSTTATTSSPTIARVSSLPSSKVPLTVTVTVPPMNQSLPLSPSPLSSSPLMHRVMIIPMAAIDISDSPLQRELDIIPTHRNTSTRGAATATAAAITVTVARANHRTSVASVAPPAAVMTNIHNDGGDGEEKKRHHTPLPNHDIPVAAVVHNTHQHGNIDTHHHHTDTRHNNNSHHHDDIDNGRGNGDGNSDGDHGHSNRHGISMKRIITPSLTQAYRASTINTGAIDIGSPSSPVIDIGRHHHNNNNNNDDNNNHNHYDAPLS